MDFIKDTWTFNIKGGEKNHSPTLRLLLMSKHGNVSYSQICLAHPLICVPRTVVYFMLCKKTCN